MKNYKTLCHPALKWMIALLPLSLQAQVHSTGGLHLVASGEVKLVFHNAGFISNGLFEAGSSTAIFTGNAAADQTFIGGNNPVSFHNVVVSKTANDVQLRNNIAVTGNIAMKSGHLQLNNYTLNLGRTGSIAGENNLSRITGQNGGQVTVTTYLDAPKSVNPGNIGIEISSDQHMGETVITRGHQSQYNRTGQLSIHRYFDIAPANNTGLNASLRFFYFDDEVNEGEEAALAFFARNNENKLWQLKGKDRSDAGGNWVTKNNLQQLHQRFTLAGAIPGMTAENSKTSLHVFPNPSPGQFTVQLYSPESKTAVINLYDQLGRLLERKQLQVQQGLNTIRWNISQYANGTYHLMFDNLDVKNVKIMKQ